MVMPSVSPDTSNAPVSVPGQRVTVPNHPCHTTMNRASAIAPVNCSVTAVA